MARRNQEIIDHYRREAKRYDRLALFYYLIGFRVQAYRKRAVKALTLSRGDTVVDLGCGTGLNFGLLEKEIGPEGTIIGVDLTDALLSIAQERVRRHGWSNVRLVQADWATFPFPSDVDGILSTFALAPVPEDADVIHASSQALRPGGHLVILSMLASWKRPEHLLARFWPILLWWITWIWHRFSSRPTAEQAQHSVTHHFQEVLSNELIHVSVTELYGGYVYIAVGERDDERRKPCPPRDHVAN